MRVCLVSFAEEGRLSTRESEKRTKLPRWPAGIYMFLLIEAARNFGVAQMTALTLVVCGSAWLLWYWPEAVFRLAHVGMPERVPSGSFCRGCRAVGAGMFLLAFLIMACYALRT